MPLLHQVTLHDHQLGAKERDGEPPPPRSMSSTRLKPGAVLTVLEPAFSTKDAAGPIHVTVLGMVAAMERKFIRERQQAGIEAAKSKVSQAARCGAPRRKQAWSKCLTTAS